MHLMSQKLVVETIVHLVQLILQAIRCDINVNPKQIKFLPCCSKLQLAKLRVNIYWENVHGFVFWFANEPNTLICRKFYVL